MSPWSKSSTTLSYGYDRESRVTAVLTKGGKTWEWDLGKQEGGGMYSRSIHVSPNWSADSRHIAILMNDPGGMHMRGPIPGKLETKLGHTALVTIMVHPSLDEAIGKNAGYRIRGDAHLPFQRIEAAKTARENTVVYFAAGYEEQAKAVIGVLVGGGTTEALSWATPADLVVALGNDEQ